MSTTIDQIWVDEAKALDEQSQRKKLKTNKVEAYNEAEYARAERENDTHVRLLHPTKGYKWYSLTRMKFSVEGKQGMAWKISETLGKARVR